MIEKLLFNLEQFIWWLNGKLMVLAWTLKDKRLARYAALRRRSS